MIKHLLSLFFFLVLSLIFLNNQKYHSNVSAQVSPLAFPGAVGFGAKTRGAFGGTTNPRIIYVTNTSDVGTGSLRAALEATGPRIVIIKTSGMVSLGSPILIKNPYLSVYGNKAPGGGLQIKNNMINIKTHDIIIRYLKIRAGDEGQNNFGDRDAVTTTCGTNPQIPFNIIIDHTEMIWGPDIGGFAATCGAHDITIQYSISGEGIVNGGHPDGPHSKGFNLSYDSGGQGEAYNVTVYKSLITTSNARMPQIRGSGRTDLINNVIYNWGDVAGEGASSGMNMIGNTWRKGPASATNCAFKANPTSGSVSRPIYVNGESLDSGMSQFCGGLSATGTQYTLSLPSTAIVSASQAYTELITNKGVGPILPVLDSVTDRLIRNVANKTGNLVQNSAADVGGWPSLASGTPYTDSDNDGMADSWESQYSLTDAMADPDGDGYRNIEEFLNDTNPKGGAGVTSSPTLTPTSTARKPGDANSDGRVDGLDYVIWLNNYGRTATGGPNIGDFNTDGRVDGLDYVIWLTNYGT